MIAINVGCGIKHAEFEGYDKTLNVDGRADVKPDVLADVMNMPVARGDVGLIYSSHLLEHFPSSDGRRLVRYWYDLLCPKGKLWIVVPNVEYACVQILRDGEPDGNSMDICLGHQEYATNFHKMIFTPKSLRKFIEVLVIFDIKSCDAITNNFEIELKDEKI